MVGSTLGVAEHFLDDPEVELFRATYDYRTRRLTKTELVDLEPETTEFRHDGGVSFQEWKDTDGDGVPEKQVAFVRGSGMGGGIGSILYSDRTAVGGGKEYFVYNAVGHTVATVNTDGSVKSTNLYEAFGSIVSNTGQSANNRLANTKERDYSTGLDNHGFRYYDKETGSYISRDPIAYADGMNVYLYVHNNPVSHIDPLGLQDGLLSRVWSKVKDFFGRGAEAAADDPQIRATIRGLDKGVTKHAGRIETVIRDPVGAAERVATQAVESYKKAQEGARQIGEDPGMVRAAAGEALLRARQGVAEVQRRIYENPESLAERAGEFLVDALVAGAEEKVVIGLQRGYRRLKGKPRLPPRGTKEYKAIKAGRDRGIRAKQRMELENIRAGGRGSGVWSDDELKAIRRTGEFPRDAYWHHDPTVANRPDLAADPNSVMVGRGGHKRHLRKGHGGDWRGPPPEGQKEP